MMRKNFLIKCVVAASLCLTAISCQKDSGSTPQQEFIDNFKALVMGGKTIDSRQNWNTVGNASVKISVDYGNESDYIVYISQSPILFDADAVYIGMARLKSGESKTINIPRPANTPLLYAACYNAKGHAVCKPFPVMEGTTEVIFTGSIPSESNTYAPTTGNKWSVPARNLPDLSAYTTGTLVNPLVATDLNDEEEVHFKIDTDFIGFVPSLGTFAKKSVYVTATWTLTFNQQVLRDNILIVGEGGKIVVPKDFRLTTKPVGNENSGLIYVLPGGEITGEGKVEFATTGGTYLYNAGIITVKEINLNGSNLYNCGQIGNPGASVTNITCDLDDNGDPGLLTNVSIAELASLTGDCLAIENAGSLKVNGELMLGSASKMDDGSYTQCSSLVLAGDDSGEKVLYMGNAAFMNCIGSISIDNFGVQGPSGSNFNANAILKIKNCTHCSTTDGMPGTYLLDHVELIIPESYPTIFDNGALSIWNTDKQGSGIGSLQESFSGYHSLRLLHYWLNGYEGRILNADNYQWKMIDDRYCLVGNSTSAAATGVDAVRQTCTYGTSPSYNYRTDYATLYSVPMDFTPKNGAIYYLFEAMEDNLKDFDYNDLVLRVNIPTDNGDGTFSSSVQVMCVGNRTKTTVLLNEEPFGEETHAAIGTPVKTPVNVSTVNRIFRKLDELSFSDGNYRIDRLDLALNMENADGDVNVEHQPTLLGEAPLYIVVNGNDVGKFFWPVEANNIGIAYPKFSIWASDIQASIDWYDRNSAMTGKVVSY